VITGDTTINTNETMLTGTAEVGSTVTVLDGATQLGTTTVNTSGAWSFTTGPMSNGAHFLTVAATDAAGNTSQASQPVDPVIDTVAPAAPMASQYTARGQVRNTSRDRAQERRRVSSSVRRRGSSVWAVIVFMFVILFATGLGQKAIDLITGLLNR